MSERRALGIDAAVAALFFLSGACGLVYQILWVRMLLPVFGTGVHAVSTVLAAFMAGLALGAWLFGRLIDRRGPSGLRLYAVLEAGIALYALLMPLMLGRLDGFYTWLYRWLDGAPGAFAVARFALSAALLLWPTTLMGATLPALVRHVALRGRPLGWSAGTLYGLNTLGAVVGCTLAAFVLIERIGVNGTNGLAAGANAIIAILAWLLGRREPAPPVAPAPTGEPAWRQAPPESPRVTRIALWGYALSGFAALGFEVVWARTLAVLLRITTTQSLSAVLIVFLLGLGAGGAAGARWVDRWRHLPRAFARLELGLGLSAMGSIVALGLAPRLTEALAAWPGWYGHLARLAATAGLVMFVPTFLMGLLFPVAAKLQAVGHADVGRRIGRVYAANTAGAIGGTLVTGFALIPWLGSQRSLLCLAALPLAVGFAVLALDRSSATRPRALEWVALGAAALALPLFLPASFLVERLRKEPGTELLYHAEGAAGTVTVHRLPDGTRMLRVNGAGEVPSDWASVRIFRLLGTLPLALHPRPEDVLVIAFGGGITLATVASQQPQRIDCAEIVPGVVEASRQLADLNGRVFERLAGGPIHMVYDDGRNHVLRTTRTYDVILSDSTHPATADSWVLYTEEFYREARARLNPGGIFAQWLPIHGLTVEDYRMIVRTFHAAFPHATLWYSQGYSILLATAEPLQVRIDEVSARLAREPLAQLLAEVDLDQAAALLATLALDERGFAAYAGDGPINTDDRPWISFRDRTRAGAAGLLIVASLAPQFVGGDQAWIAGGDAAAREAVARRMTATRLTLGAEIAVARGDRSGAIAALRRALELAPHDETARRRLALWAAESPGPK